MKVKKKAFAIALSFLSLFTNTNINVSAEYVLPNLSINNAVTQAVDY